MPLSGETPQNNSPVIADILIICVMMTPVFAIVGFVGWKVIESLITGDFNAEAIVGTPFAVLMIGLLLLRFRWTFYVLPRLTILSFTLDEDDLFRFNTLRDGSITVPLSSLLVLKKHLISRSSHADLTLLGWWIRFPQRRWHFLPVTNSTAEELVDRMHAAQKIARSESSGG